MADRRRRRVILGWLAAFALVIGLSVALGGDFAADYSAPGSDSKQAQDLLEQRFPVQAGNTVDVVVRSGAGVTGSAVRSDVTALLRELGGMPHVAAAEDPYKTTVVRMLLVPAIMHLLGRANWWLPRSVDRRLPQLRVEGRPEAFVPGPRSAAARRGSTADTGTDSRHVRFSGTKT